MKLSQFIDMLERVLDEEGDIEVVSMANENIAPKVDVIGAGKPRWVPNPHPAKRP